MSLTVPGKNPDVSRGMPAIAMVGVAAAGLAAPTLLGPPPVTFRPPAPAPYLCFQAPQ